MAGQAGEGAEGEGAGGARGRVRWCLGSQMGDDAADTLAGATGVCVVPVTLGPESWAKERIWGFWGGGQPGCLFMRSPLERDGCSRRKG